jgi:hypothetical protein
MMTAEVSGRSFVNFFRTNDRHRAVTDIAKVA